MQSGTFPQQPPIPGYEPIRPWGINLGTMYLARHSGTGTFVILSVWPLEFAAHARDLHAPLARLHHPNIIRLIEMGEFGRNFFCALEYVEHTLADRLLGGPLTAVDAARLAQAVGSALQYAYEQGMIPVTMTPKAVFLTDDNTPKLSDFCPSERLVPNLISPALMPPELFLAGAGRAGEAGLVYRLGVLIYEMLTARPPFAADKVPATLNRVLHEMPQPPGLITPRVTSDLEAICMKCLAKLPEHRYASLEELTDCLKHFAGL